MNLLMTRLTKTFLLNLTLSSLFTGYTPSCQAVTFNSVTLIRCLCDVTAACAFKGANDALGRANDKNREEVKRQKDFISAIILLGLATYMLHNGQLFSR